jgi:hypothetical protein
VRIRSGSVALAAALLLPAAPAAALTDTDYFAFADRVVLGLRIEWDAAAGAYVSREKGAAARTNANMLVLHSVAALHGHAGATRQDARARALVERMTRPPMFRLSPVRTSATRAVCWAKRLTSGEPDHISLDSQVAEALAWAWRARARLRLAHATAQRIARTVDSCARHSAWRFPYALKNQINWNAQLYASAALATGRSDLLRRDYRRHLLRFTARRPPRGMRARNLGPDFGFRYSPHLPASVPTNFDTPEYANIVMTALQYYRGARRAGMRALPARSVALMRAWVTRLLAGSWTHAGYLNWDTGHGWHRWHSGQYWAFSQQGLLAIATAPRFWARPAYGRWAKALFDSGLLLHRRWTSAAGRIVISNPFDVRSAHHDLDLYATRIAANAARAIALGLGARGAVDPPPLYAYDQETGRLAVTTPRYSTAIVPTNRGAFPYGGIELARLLGPGHRVAANIGGEPPNAFGVVVRGRAGHELPASQRAKAWAGRLRITRSPRGPVGHPRPYAAHAGPFRTLEARGTVARGTLRIATTHRFRPDHIDVRWDVRCRGGACGPYTVDVHLPTWGATAAIDATGLDGLPVRLAGPGAGGGRTLALAAAARVALGRGRLGGYSVVPLHRPAGAVLLPVATSRQPTDTDPGPTLAIRLIARGHVGRVSLSVRLRPFGG